MWAQKAVELETGRQKNASKICVGPLARRPGAPAKVDIRPLFYWHLQKAGSSFMNLLILSGCYGQFRPFKNPTDFVQYIKGQLETICPAGFSRFLPVDMPSHCENYWRCVSFS